jgi:4-hydroxyacetophenone monooxygenase
VTDDKTIDDALDAAHLPALMTALVHLTGNADHLKPEWRPNYTFMARADIGVSADEQVEMRAFARGVIKDYLAGGEVVADLPPPTIRRMMDYVTGVDIPENYGDYLADELALTGQSSKDPQWETPALRSAAAKMHVVVVGAGMSGIAAGIRLRQAGIPFTIIEKNADVGGTWLENSYPGCRVDSSNHMYSYSFEPNHLWPYHFSTQPVLLDYFRKVAAKYDLARDIRFETEVASMVWDEARAVWLVHTRAPDGRESRMEATAVITAVGQLNRPRLPEIEGRDSFAGEAFHSARWRHDVDLTGKRVAVIGTGASAFQFIPEIAGKVKKLTVFQRTPPWVFPTPNYHAEVPEGKKWTLENIPFYDKWYRFWLLWMATDGLLPAVKVDPDYAGPSTAISERNLAFREMIAGAIAAQAPGLADRVTPSYPVGGKRALLDNGVYFQALQRENVELITDPIARITPSGVATRDETERDFDVIIYGTGFQASRFLSPMKIVGLGGAELHDRWAGDPRAYLGMTAPGFPNLFMIYGPNTNIVVNGSIIFFSECSVRYILGCLKLLAQGARSIEVRPDVHDAFNTRVDAANKLMAWGSPNVTSWYKNDKGRVTQNWPFALVDYWRATLAPDLADFTVKTRQTVAADG